MPQRTEETFTHIKKCKDQFYMWLYIHKKHSETYKNDSIKYF